MSQTDPIADFITCIRNAQAVKKPMSDATGDVIGERKDRIDRFTLSDIKELDKNGREPLKRGQSGVETVNIVRNPFTGKNTPSFSRVRTRHQRSGETVASANIVIDLETQNDPIPD